MLNRAAQPFCIPSLGQHQLMRSCAAAMRRRSRSSGIRQQDAAATASPTCHQVYKGAFWAPNGKRPVVSCLYLISNAPPYTHILPFSTAHAWSGQSWGHLTSRAFSRATWQTNPSRHAISNPAHPDPAGWAWSPVAIGKGTGPCSEWEAAILFP